MPHQTNTRPAGLAEIGNAVFQMITIALVDLLGLAEAVHVLANAVA